MSSRDDTGRILRSIEESADGVVAELSERLDLTIRERQLARGVAGLLVPHLAGLMRDRPDNLRLAELEVRADAIEDWRATLTGVDDRNGRVGRLDAAVAELRKDVGPPDEARLNRDAAADLRSIKRRLRAAVVFAALSVGGGAWGVIQARDAARDAAIRAEARTSGRLDHLEDSVRILFGFHQHP